MFLKISVHGRSFLVIDDDRTEKPPFPTLIREMKSITSERPHAFDWVCQQNPACRRCYLHSCLIPTVLPTMIIIEFTAKQELSLFKVVGSTNALSTAVVIFSHAEPPPCMNQDEPLSCEDPLCSDKAAATRNHLRRRRAACIPKKRKIVCDGE